MNQQNQPGGNTREQKHPGQQDQANPQDPNQADVGKDRKDRESRQPGQQQGGKDQPGQQSQVDPDGDRQDGESRGGGRPQQK